MDRTALAALLRSWMDGAGFSTQKQLAAAMSREFPIDTGTLSRLLNGIDRVKVTRPMVEAFANACSVDATPALALAGFVVSNIEWPVPERIVGILGSWDAWELDILADELPSWRSRLHRIADEVRHSPLVNATATADNPSTATQEETGGTARQRFQRRRASPAGPDHR